jgi:hypothetical protein
MLAQFEPESFADAKSSSCQKGKEHLIAALGSFEDLFDFVRGKRRLALLFLVYDRKSDEVELPTARIPAAQTLIIREMSSPRKPPHLPARPPRLGMISVEHLRVFGLLCVASSIHLF